MPRFLGESQYTRASASEGAVRKAASFSSLRAAGEDDLSAQEHRVRVSTSKTTANLRISGKDNNYLLRFRMRNLNFLL